MNKKKRQRNRILTRLKYAFFYRRIRIVLKGIRVACSNSPLLYLPFFGLFVLNATDFVVLFEFENAAMTNLFFVDEGVWTEDTDLRNRVEQTKSKIKSYVLLLTFLLALFNIEKIISFFLSNRNVLVLFAVMLAGYTYSIEPAKVITNVANIGFSFVSCILVVICSRSQKSMIRHSLILLFLSCTLVLIGSAVLFVMLQEQSLSQVSLGKRFGGLAGHPNALGLLAVIGIWSGLAIITEKSRSIFSVVVVALFILIFVGLLLSTASATSLVLTVVAAAFVVWGRFVQKFNYKTGFALNLGIGAFALLAAFATVMATSGVGVLSNFTESLGKDSTFTGRTNLWAIGIEAFLERPLLGWSYDSHMSVFANPRYDLVLLHQYHNGYIDTLVAGGILLFTAVLVHIYYFIKNGLSVFLIDRNAYIAMTPLILLLIHNLTEYSMLRINSMLWIVFMLCYVMLASYSDVNDHPKKTSQVPRRKKRRRSGYRFA